MSVQPQISEQLLALSEVALTLDRLDVEDLRRLVARTLADVPLLERRELQLGLLIELVSDHTGERVLAERYDEEVQRRRRLNDDWPPRSTLANAYGSWARAVRAAMAVAFGDPCNLRPSVNNRHHQFRRAFTREEIIAGIAASHDELGHWPYESEFAEWGRVMRELARVTGAADPRLPSRSAILRRFPSFDHALRAAQRDG